MDQNILNSGLQVYILWPSFRPNGDPLLYLASQPMVEGLGKCDFVTEVNPYQVKVKFQISLSGTWFLRIFVSKVNESFSIVYFTLDTFQMRS